MTKHTHRLALAALVTLFPLAHPRCSAEDDPKPRQLDIGWKHNDGTEASDKKSLFKVVQSLQPSLTSSNLLRGVDLTLIYTTMPHVPDDFYILRVYSARNGYEVTLVNRYGVEVPVDKLGLIAFVVLWSSNADIPDLFPSQEGCVVECDAKEGFCLQTCIISDTWPDDWPPLPKPPQ